MKKLVIIVSIMLVTFLAKAGENEDLIFQANAAYADEKYSAALELYRKVVSNGWEAPELYYNMGNACFKTGDFTAAIWYYEKALRLDPSNENCDFNLKVANTKIIDRIETVPPPFYKKWWNVVGAANSVSGWAVWSIITFTLLLLFVALFLFARSVNMRKLNFWLAVVTLIAVISVNIFAYSQYRQMQSLDNAIIFEPTVNVKSSPDEKSQDIFVIHEGTKVRITDKVGEWCEIRIANGSLGWIKVSTFRII